MGSLPAPFHARVELSAAFNLEPVFSSGQARILSCVQGLCPCEVLLLQCGFVKGSKHGLPNVAAVRRSKSLVKACENMKA